jgi:hypothetical protein
MPHPAHARFATVGQACASFVLARQDSVPPPKKNAGSCEPAAMNISNLNDTVVSIRSEVILHLSVDHVRIEIVAAGEGLVAIRHETVFERVHQLRALPAHPGDGGRLLLLA